MISKWLEYVENIKMGVVVKFLRLGGGWLVGAQVHGLPNPYLENCIVHNCFLCSTPKISHVPNSSNQHKKTEFSMICLFKYNPKNLKTKSRRSYTNTRHVLNPNIHLNFIDRLISFKHHN